MRLTDIPKGFSVKQVRQKKPSVRTVSFAKDPS